MNPHMLVGIVEMLIGAAGVVGLCGAAVMILRWTGLSRPTPEEQGFSATAWALIGSAFAAYFASTALMHSQLQLTRPAAVGVFLALLAGQIGILVGRRLLRRDRTRARVARRAERGDVAGAIAELQAALDRGSPRAADPADDPWAPPRAGLGADERRAGRLDLMGSLHAAQGDREAALDWYRRAERAGGLRPVTLGHIGATLVDLGRDDEGFAALRAALAGVPEAAPLDRHRRALDLARRLLDRARPAEARAALDQAAEALRASRPFLAGTKRRLDRELAALRVRLSRGPG